MKTFLLITMLIVFTSTVFSQNCETSSQALALSEKVENGFTKESLNAILIAGDSHDTTLIPCLKKIAHQPSNPFAVNTAQSFAQIALAKLGEEDYLLIILNQVDGENIYLQDAAIEKLSYVGGKTVFRTFLRLLDDRKYRAEKVSLAEFQMLKAQGLSTKKGDEILMPRSILAMRLLAKMVDNPPISPDITPTLEDIALWKSWFEKNKQLLD